MKLFNSLQIVSLLASGPVWLLALYTATFTGAIFAFWIGVIVLFILFVWAVAVFVDSMK